MKRLVLLFFMGLLAFESTMAQKQSFDLFSFTPPAGWKMTSQENTIAFTTTNNTDRTWAQVNMVKSTVSKGSIKSDFESEWNELVVKPYKQYGVTEQALAIDTQTFQGWKLWTGLGKFVFNKDTAAVLLNTFSDGQRCASFTIMSNTTSFGPVLDEFIGSINMQNPGSTKAQPNNTPVSNGQVYNNSFQFTITNFDDGWTSVVKENWVEATKGNIKVLIHYPRKEDEVYISDRTEKVNTFWNLLVAPRYRNLRNYSTPTNYLYETAFFASGLVNENASGKDVWVTLFSKGKTGWIEIITPDKKTFVDAFHIDNPDSYFSAWEPLVNLSGLNRFSVGENDIYGKWSTEFTGSTAYYGLYTGIYAGSSTYASQQSFEFEKTKTYKWNLVVAKSGLNTSMQVDKVNASGNYKFLGNWQIWFSDIEKKPKTYNAYFSCIKGGRILWLQDVSYGSYTAYGKIIN